MIKILDDCGDDMIAKDNEWHRWEFHGMCGRGDHASRRHWADPSMWACWIHCCHSSRRGAHQRTASPSLLRPIKMNSPLPCFTWQVSGTCSVPVCSSWDSDESVSSLPVKSSSTPSMPFHLDGMGMNLGDRLLLLGAAGRPLMGWKTDEAWRMTRVARTVSNVRSNCASL